MKSSEILRDISLNIPEEGLNFRDFLELIGGRGILLANLILVAPFLLPVSIPGSSLPFGLAIILINLRNLLGGRVLLPDFVLNYKISQNNVISIFNGIINVLQGLERFIKPRFIFMNNHTSITTLNSFLIVINAFWLMLPLPIPLTDFLPAYCILFLTLGSLENDGILILAGYILTIITTVYFFLMFFVGIEVINYVLHYMGVNISF